MRSRFIGITLVLLAVAFSAVSGRAATTAPPVFTGDVEVDFSSPQDLIVVDPGGIDVGVPLTLNGIVSGNDMKDVRFFYDAAADILYIGINTYVIAGDVDGDGDPGLTSPALALLGGIDMPDFGGKECFAVMLDLDEDGIFDVIAGVSRYTDTSGYAVCQYLVGALPKDPSRAFGAPLVGHTGILYASPSAAEPDLEFTILNFSTLPSSSGADSSTGLGVKVFVGSFQDAGIGEDFIPGDGNTTLLFGSLGDFVWDDSNKDGVQDVDEPGIEGVTVELYDAADLLLDTTVTDAIGFYEFVGLEAGQYTVKIADSSFETGAPLAAYTPSPANAGTDDALDSDGDETTHEVIVDLGPIEHNPTIDFGFFVPPSTDAPGTGTPGYWMNHPDAWPVDTIKIGGILYTKEEAIAGIAASVKNDKTYTLFASLVCAKLNVLVGNESSDVDAIIDAADAWMALYPLGSGVRAGGKDSPWRDAEPLHLVLDDYNNGLLCAPHRQ